MTSLPERTTADRTGELVQRVAEVIDERHRAQIIPAIDPQDGTTAPFILKPSGNVEVLSPDYFDGYRAQPRRVTDTATATRLGSFIDLVNRFKNPRSAVFAAESMTAPRLSAIIDYHEPSDTAGKIVPAFCTHHISYPFPLSREWKTWTGKNSVKMNLIEFAAFIEDNIVNVVDIDPAALNDDAQTFVKAAQGNLATPTKLFELSRGLAVHENSQVVEVRNLASGEGQVTFKSEHVDSDGKPLSVPNMFVICIPVWDRSSDYYRIVSRLRYRKGSDGLTFWYELWRADLVLQTAFDEVIAQVEKETALPVFIGAAGR